MEQTEKVSRLKSMLSQVAPGAAVESLRPPSLAGGEYEVLEGFAPGAAERADTTVDRAIEKVSENREQDLTNEEVFALEAIILPRERPVVFVRGASYDRLTHPQWLHLNDAPVKNRIGPLLRSVARIEVPSAPWIPYGGTGFVVGPDLLMTNRHVAKLFSDGVGLQIRYRDGDAAVDFNKDVDSRAGDTTALFKVVKVEMVHPFWDMALLRVRGLSEQFRPLSLSVRRPEDLVDREVIAVGFPARDDRNDLSVQDQIFERKYNVKRMQPGKIRPRRSIRSFESTVNAMTHDSSTLGGNSGSAVLDLQTGEVLGLHFAGVYLDANYAVPAFELARDSRVAKIGLNFGGSVASTTDFDAAWRRVDPKEGAATPPAPVDAAAQSPTVATSSGSNAVQWTIPIHVAISIGQPAQVTVGRAVEAVPTAIVEAPKLQMPKIYGGLENRKGYRPGFLELANGDEVPFNILTETGKSAAAKLEDGSTELKYHKFSAVMHKGRRLAIYTGSNVDWRPSVRTINGKKPTRGELTGIPDGVAELWSTDWRIDAEHQLPDIFFTKDGGAFDKGHIVRRDDVCWGSSFKDMQKGNGDTYHTTNCSPQTSAFNQSAQGEDNWGDLENLVQKETKAEKAILFAGPVLAEDDPLFEGRDEDGKLVIRVPRAFWKIVVVKGTNGPEAYGFVLEQDLSALEFAVPAQWRQYMKSIEEIEEMLGGLVDLGWLKQFDRIESDESVRISEQLT